MSCSNTNNIWYWGDWHEKGREIFDKIGDSSISLSISITITVPPDEYLSANKEFNKV